MPNNARIIDTKPLNNLVSDLFPRNGIVFDIKPRNTIAVGDLPGVVRVLRGGSPIGLLLALTYPQDIDLFVAP